MSPGGHAASAQTGISAKDQAGFVGVASNPAGATTSYKKVPRVWSQPCACLQLQKVENRSGVDREIKLTERGQQVAELIALGLSNRDIARRLFLSERTVEWHVEQVLNRLGFSSRTEIAAWIGRTQSGTPVRSPSTIACRCPGSITPGRRQPEGARVPPRARKHPSLGGTPIRRCWRRLETPGPP